ncbi:hypothetical protein HU200_006554 [Digitaria exilis]|uniref:DUF7378 domain-containing protein n=1 Tax=Digitaria exilis TaxID=1010633 RepID=A0A835FQ15_9POAL|nr:hypothetical protein HU200_006554 [Digitaria exilis]
MGESMAHTSRVSMWILAVFSQILCPGVIMSLLYAFGPSFFVSVPWRLALLLSWGAYTSLLYLIQFHAVLFLPRAPVAVVERFMSIGLWGVNVSVISVMAGAVFAFKVHDRRVLAGCTAVVATFIVAVVAFWVWLARTYGGAGDTSLTTSSSESESTAGRQYPCGVARVPI